MSEDIPQEEFNEVVESHVRQIFDSVRESITADRMTEICQPVLAAMAHLLSEETNAASVAAIVSCAAAALTPLVLGFGEGEDAKEFIADHPNWTVEDIEESVGAAIARVFLGALEKCVTGAHEMGDVDGMLHQADLSEFIN